MDKMRFVAKAAAGSVAVAALLMGALAGPAQAARDTGWGPSSPRDSVNTLTDTGWGP